jgi:hypothetical protein
VVVVFSQQADDNLASLVKAVDEVQKTNSKLGSLVVGIGGVQPADLEKLQDTHKLTSPLCVMAKADQKDGPKGYNLSKEAAVTVIVYKKGDQKNAKVFAYSDTKSAAAKAKDIATAAQDVLK